MSGMCCLSSMRMLVLYTTEYRTFTKFYQTLILCSFKSGKKNEPCNDKTCLRGY